MALPLSYILQEDSVFFGDPDFQTIEIIGKFDLAAEPRKFVTVIAAFKQVILVFAHFRQFRFPVRVDMNMAGGAGAAAAAQRQQLVKAIIANRFHDADSAIDGNRFFFAIAAGYVNRWHSYPLVTVI
ncbi:MAG: hypothetical protein ACI9TB_001546 [Parasphingorhabdus sp.]|jgi:hypothetical protein